MDIGYKPSFIRQFNKLSKDLQEEVIAKIDLLKDTDNHRSLKVHKLKGRLKGFYGLSVDYKNRIIFEYISDSEGALLAVGDHDIYNT